MATNCNFSFPLDFTPKKEVLRYLKYLAGSCQYNERHFHVQKIMLSMVSFTSAVCFPSFLGGKLEKGTYLLTTLNSLYKENLMGCAGEGK